MHAQVYLSTRQSPEEGRDVWRLLEPAFQLGYEVVARVLALQSGLTQLVQIFSVVLVQLCIFLLVPGVGRGEGEWGGGGGGRVGRGGGRIAVRG